MYVRVIPPPRKAERLAKNIGKVISVVGFAVILATVTVALTALWKKIFP